MANGWNRPSGDVKPAPKKNPTAIRGALAGIAVVILAATAAYFIIFRGNETRQDDASKKERGRIKEVTPAPTPKAVKVEPTNEVVKVKRKPTPEEQKKLRPGDEGFDPAAHPFVLIPKKKKEPVVLPYRNATEQALAWIANCQPGDPPLPLIPIPEAEMKRFTEILLDKNEVQEGDSEQTVEQRRIIEYAKSEMRQYIKNGGDPMSFMKYYHDQLEHQCMVYREAQNSVMEMLRTSDNDDIAAEYIKKVNARLASEGIKQVILSKKKLERHGLTSDALGISEQAEKGEIKK